MSLESFIKSTGEVIGTWPTLKEASEATGAGRIHIGEVCKGINNRLTAGNVDGKRLGWRYKDILKPHKFLPKSIEH